MRRILQICLLSTFFSISAFAQQLRPASAPEIYRELKTLKNLPKVLYIAAHPDDENTGLLSWLVNDQNVATAYFSLTRGDGGQNLLGKEQGAALGLIRTYELLEARKLDGAQQFFSRAIDFGFSKNTKDTFKQWDADSITADVVWMIRKFRPDVIICRFPPTAAAGHGQHAGSAVVAEMAFKAAGDPSKYPGQLKYVNTWQPTRLLFNSFRFGSTDTTNPQQLQVNAGNYDPLLGMGYGELAGISRSLHKSQGAGTPSTPGLRTEYFSHVAGLQATHSIFDGINKSWKTIGYPDIDAALEKILAEFSFVQPENSLPALLALKNKIASIKDDALKKDKLPALDRLILSCAGFMGEAVAPVAEAVAGERIPFRLNLIARSKIPVVVEEIKWLSQVEKTGLQLTPDILKTLNHEIELPENTPLTEPYWLAAPAKDAAQFSVANDTLIGLAEKPSDLNVVLKLSIGKTFLNVSLPLSYKKLDPVKGDLIEPIRIVPAVNVKFTQPVYFLHKGEDLVVTLNFAAAKKFETGTVTFKSGNQTIASFPSVSLEEMNQAKTFTLKKEWINNAGNGQFKLSASYTAGNVTYNKDQQIIRYPHLPTLQYFLPAAATVINADIKITAKKVGYIEGAGDVIPDFLREAGVQVDILTETDILTPARLNTYDAIVTGVRVINTEKRIRNWQTALRAYVENGGTMVMQYNTSQDMALTDFGIYPFTMSNLRVTEEDAAVKFLNPKHPLLNYPNKITKADFDHWVQERGTYFPSKWDNKYEPLFEMNDTGEAPLQGATLVAKYGKGNFIYTPLTFFRQLPAGNPGAARLFFNFLSAGK